MTSDLERAAAFEEALWDACAERIVPSSLGTAVFNDTLHRVWSLNVLRVEKTDASVGEMAAEAERLQGEAGLLHRRVFVADSNAGRELEEPFTELGWKTDAFVFMEPRRKPNREIDLSAVVEVESDALGPLEETIIRETLTDVDEETVHQIQEANLMVAAAGQGRHFAVVVDGLVVSSADLYSDGSTAQIEDVGTLAEFRGHGYASAVVMRALAEAHAAGHDFVFLVADARDWPKELYRRLGFDPIGEKYAYLRSPVDTG
jgi:ribosomal protein S18 acetylase RimI-like enzyme